MKISRPTTLALIACASLATSGCLKNQDQSGNQEQQVQGSVSQTVSDYNTYLVPGREWNSFRMLNPGYVLTVSRVIQYSVGRDNSITESTKNWRLEVKKLNEVGCKDPNGDDRHDNRKVFKFHFSGDTCWELKKDASLPSSDFQLKTLKAISSDGTIAANMSNGIFYQNQLVGATDDFICRPTEIGRRFQEFSEDGKTQVSRTYAVVGCTLPQMVKGKFGKNVITLTPQQVARPKPPVQPNQGQTDLKTTMTNPPLSSTSR